MALPMTIQEVMAAMPGAFRPDKASGVQARFQFNLTGEGGGVWTVTVADGQCTVQEGATESPNAFIEASAADYLAISRGELEPMKAFMSGKLKAKGDMALLLRFMQFFNLTPST